MQGLFFWNSGNDTKSQDKIVEFHYEQLEESDSLDQLETSALKIYECAKQNPQLVSEKCMPGLLDILGRLQDQGEEITKSIIDTIVYLAEVPDKNGDDINRIVIRTIGQICENGTHLELLLVFAVNGSFAIRKTILNLLQFFVSVDQDVFENGLLSSQDGVQSLLTTLSDPNEEICMASLTIIKDISLVNKQIQKQFAFQDLFEILYDLMNERIDQDDVVDICFLIVNNMIKEDDGIRKLFLGSSMMKILPFFLSSDNTFKDEVFDGVVEIFENLLQIGHPANEDSALESARQKNIKETKISLVQNTPLLLENLCTICFHLRSDIQDDIVLRCIHILGVLLTETTEGCASMFNNVSLDMNGKNTNIIVYLLQLYLNKSTPSDSPYISLLSSILPALSSSFLRQMVSRNANTPGMYILTTFCNCIYMLLHPEEIVAENDSQINSDLYNKEFSFLYTIYENILTYRENNKSLQQPLLDVICVERYESIPLIHMFFNVLSNEKAPLFMQVHISSLLTLWLEKSVDTYMYITSFPAPMFTLLDVISAGIQEVKSTQTDMLKVLAVRCIPLCSLITCECDPKDAVVKDNNYINKEHVQQMISTKVPLEKIMDTLQFFYSLPAIQDALQNKQEDSIFSTSFLSLSYTHYELFQRLLFSSPAPLSVGGNDSNTKEIIKQYQDVIQDKDQEIEQLKQYISSLESKPSPSPYESYDNNELEQLKKKYSDLLTENTYNKNEIDQLTDEIQKINEEKEQIEKEKVQKDEEIDTMKHTNESLEKELETIKEENIQIKEENSHMKEEVQGKENIVKNTEDEDKYKEMNDKIVELESSLKQKEQEVIDFQKKIEEYEERNKDFETKLNEIEDYKQKIEDYKQKIDNYEMNISSYLKSIDDLKITIDQLEKENKEKEDENTLKENHIDELEQEYNDIQLEKNKLESNYNNINQDIEEKNKQIESLESTIKELQSIKTYEEENKSLMEHNQELSNQIEELLKNKNDMKTTIDSLTSDIAKLQEEISNKEKDIEIEKEKVIEMEKEKENNINTNKETDETIQLQYEEEINKNKEHITLLENNIRDMLLQSNNYKSKIDELTQSLEDANIKLESQKKQINTLQQTHISNDYEQKYIELKQNYVELSQETLHLLEYIKTIDNKQ